jgi:hypothetical protein
MRAYDDTLDNACMLERPDAFCASHAALDALTVTLAGAEAGCWTHDQPEDHLETRGREVLRLLLQDHLDLRAIRERQAVQQQPVQPVTDAGGIGHRKMEQGHARHLATMFGKVRVTRCAWRADGARNLYPADAALNLPQRLHSHGLGRRAAIEAARGSFQAAQQAVTRQCGKVAGNRQVEQLTVAAATDIDSFYRRPAPQPCSDGTLLVASVDGKGVAMRPRGAARGHPQGRSRQAHQHLPDPAGQR